MSYRVQSSFSTGELTPELYERTDFEKYRAGLITARNVTVGKSGRLISRGGTTYEFLTKFPDKQSVLFSPPYTQWLLEWGDLYVRVHDTVNGGFVEYAHALSDSVVNQLHFVPAGKFFIYIFCTGFPVLKLGYSNILLPGSAGFITSPNIFFQPIQPNIIDFTTSATGQLVDYAISYIYNGQESDYVELINSGLREPINNNENNFIRFNLPYPNFSFALSNITAISYYRRPTGGGAYGFLGTFPAQQPSVTQGPYSITDYNGPTVPDFTHSPPKSIPIVQPSLDHTNPIINVTSKTGAIYQQRLLMSDDKSSEAIYGSRTGLQNDFFAETTLTADSAISFKSGSTGSANVLRLFDSQYGLLVFTTIGVFQNSGALSFQNLALNKASSIVIQDNVPPLEVPGGLIICDKSTNSIQSFIFSFVEQTFPPDELSIFSNHLFQGRKVVSWAFQDGEVPLIWIVFDDGGLVSLTYKHEQQMRAWTRHDSAGGLFESVTVLKDLNAQSVAYFQVNRNGVRSIETIAPRYAEFSSTGPRINLKDLKPFVAMDAAVTFNENIGAAAGGATLNIVAQDLTNWSGLLNLNSSLNTWIDAPDQGGAGTIYRFFDSQGAAVDLEVVTFVDSENLVVQPMFGLEFPEDQGVNITLYGTFSVLTGLDHLEGQKVSILRDGYVEASPNNNIEEYTTYYVVGGQITLANGKLGAFVNVGLPFTADVETLDIDTVEQKPALLESKIIHKVYVRVLNSRGLYIGNEFPENDCVEGMIDPETFSQNPITGNIGNRAQPLISKRYNVSIPNDWGKEDSIGGHICVRQVDPLPFEILSIIPDLEVVV